jgi:hypothetical protein
MKKIENLNDIKAVKMLRAEYQAAIDAVSAKYGLNGEIGRITYEENEIRCKLTISVPAKIINSTLSNPNLKNTNTLVGNRYQLRNSIYTVTGIKDNQTLLAENQNGRKFKIKVSQLSDLIKL